jgi:hypothetical protein
MLEIHRILCRRCERSRVVLEEGMTLRYLMDQFREAYFLMLSRDICR